MVIDGSAALAILLGESGDETFADAIDADPTCLMSAVSAQETAIVVEARKGPAGGRELDLLLHRGRSMSLLSMRTNSSWPATPTAATARGATRSAQIRRLPRLCFCGRNG